MEAILFRDIVRGLIFVEIFLSSVCVGSSPCMPEEDPSGRYTVIGSSVNIWSEGIPTGARVQVSVRCNQGTIAQPSVVARCFNGTWLKPWPRCVYAPETPCSVPTNRADVRQFVNGWETVPITGHTSPTLPAGTQLVARCKDPGKFRLIGDQRRTCYGGEWTGVEPECHSVITQISFDGAPRQLSSNGTVVVFVYNGHPSHLDVMCNTTTWGLSPRLTTPLENDGELRHWRTTSSLKKRLNPIAIEHSGTFTCSSNTSSHSVHVLFKVGSLPCMPDADPSGRYTVNGGSINIWSEGISSGVRVQVSVRCDQDAIAQPSAVVQCFNGIWLQPWPRCVAAERTCSVPTNGDNVLQFVDGVTSMPITRYTSPTLPDGAQLVARCRDPGKFRLSGDQRRICTGGEWIGVEPQCNSVITQLSFYGAKHQVASNGTVVVYVDNGQRGYLDVLCRSSKWGRTNPRLTTTLENDDELPHWHHLHSHRIRLNPIAIEHSGTFTCTRKKLSHSVHVLFKAADCDAPTVPEHGRLLDGYRAIILSGTYVSFECEEGYRLVGAWMNTCQQGQWSDAPPVCTVNRCPELLIPENALMEGVYGYGRNIGDERIFYCRDGYVLRGDANNLLCIEGGVWSDVLPTCEDTANQACVDPGLVQNGVRIADDYSFGAEVTYFCNPDYTLHGSSRRVCTPFGEWSGFQPYCALNSSSSSSSSSSSISEPEASGDGPI